MGKVSKSLLQGAKEALEHAQGKKAEAIQKHQVSVPKEVDVKAIREELHMSRSEFSDTYGLNPRTLEKWERGERSLDSAARAYLTVIGRNPKAIKNALVGDNTFSGHGA